MRHNYTVRISEDEAEWLKEEAQCQGRSVANLIRLLILKYREDVEKRQRLDKGGDEHGRTNASVAE